MGVILRRCFTLSLCLYGFGFILWVLSLQNPSPALVPPGPHNISLDPATQNLEHILCPHVQNLQLHAWWHLFAGLGTHFLVGTVLGVCQCMWRCVVM